MNGNRDTNTQTAKRNFRFSKKKSYYMNELEELYAW